MQVVKLVSHVSFLLLMLMFQPALARAPAGLAKPNCPDHCGNISIPYPFGIGKDCYMAESYDVECDETSTPPRASLRSIKMDLVNITLEGGAVVKGPVISVDSLRRQEVLPLNLEGTPFFVFNNYFIAVGCNTRATLWTKTGTTEHVGCDSICSNGTSISNIRVDNGPCSGKDCCQGMRWPSLLQVFNSTFELIDAKQGSDGRILAFLADMNWVYDNIWSPQDINKLASTVHMSLAWILNSNSWTYNKDTMDCSGLFLQINSTATVMPPGCSCSEGYEGNPYLQCRDIDECKDRNNTCHGLTRCVNTKGSYKCKLHPLLLTLLVIGLALGVLFLLIGAWWMSKLIKRRRCIQLKKKFFKRNGGLLLQQQLSSSDGSVRKTKVFSSNELEKATDFFNENRILGHGGQGTVYKGMLADGSIVAVKKSTIVDEDKLEEFINEVVILSQISHRNVVRLLGCCLETDVPLLVYEFIPNGNLYKYIHVQNDEFLLSWEMRLRIAIEVAGALSYLHSAASIPVYHSDIKSTNMLLDEKYRATISDFGSSRSIAIDQTHLTTHVQGTFGYLDPEYFQSSQFTEKSDVYSFGVVLVELLSGQKPIFSASPTESRSLATHFIMLMEDNRLFDILDARVKEHCHNEEVVAVGNLARKCLNLNGKNRPTMKEITTVLERVIQKGSNVQQDSQENENIMADLSMQYMGCISDINNDL
ncbi:wall-associated receptor kinase-like 8 [Populus alba x Populus x berolinensis]|uniref:Wall-associated receptor kinase-like 8 n=1 Tax=Populus alba x Populus x berolinensis TaxID=444605 RepID=A0AAD6R9H9_9ROSI|nr:wall-associated receptor kinase-like 8 [Populus alba x Populus x berolinensis]